jgi:hypothetical protein
LCVSRPSRYGQLQRAILDFVAQTHIERELVVVVDNAGDFSSAVQAFVDQLMLPDNGPKIHVLSRLAKSQLEGLAYGAAFAGGEILTLWDDDNLNHPDRLKEQLEVQVQPKFKQAITVLSEGMYYFWKDNDLFVVAMDRPDGTAAQRTLPSTMMAYRQFFPALEPNARSKPSETLLNNAAKAGRKIVPIGGKPYLHVVGVTHDNLRTYEYHRGVAQSQGRTATWLNANKDNLTAAAQAITWPGPVDVEGSDGGAFKLTPKKVWPDTMYAVILDAPAETEQPVPAQPKPGGSSTTGTGVAQKMTSSVTPKEVK